MMIYCPSAYICPVGYILYRNLVEIFSDISSMKAFLIACWDLSILLSTVDIEVTKLSLN